MGLSKFQKNSFVFVDIQIKYTQLGMLTALAPGGKALPAAGGFVTSENDREQFSGEIHVRRETQN